MLYIDRLDDDGRKAVLAELRRIELGLVEPRGRRAHIASRLSCGRDRAYRVPRQRPVVGARRSTRSPAEPDLAVALVVTNPPKAAGRGDALRPTAVADAARRLGVPLVEVAGVRLGPGAEALAAARPDAIVVVAYGEILRHRDADHGPVRRGEPAFLAVASMARRLARPACDRGRRHEHRRDGDADGRGPGHRPDPRAARRADPPGRRRRHARDAAGAYRGASARRRPSHAARRRGAAARAG